MFGMGKSIDKEGKSKSDSLIVDSYLLESDVVSGFAETTSANVHVVLANHTVMIEASSAKKYS